MSILHGTEQKEKIVLNLRILKKIKTRLLTFKASASLKEINDRSAHLRSRSDCYGLRQAERKPRQEA